MVLLKTGSPILADLISRHFHTVNDRMGGKAIKSIVDWLTRKAHHRNTSVICITQNVFDGAVQHHIISLKAHYLVLFKNPEDHV